MGNGTSQEAGDAITNNDFGSGPADAPGERNNLTLQTSLQNSVSPRNSTKLPANEPQGSQGLPGMLQILLFFFATIFIASGVHVNSELRTSRNEITHLKSQIKYSKNEIFELEASIENQKKYFEKSIKTSEAKVQAFQDELKILNNKLEALNSTQCQCEKSKLQKDCTIWDLFPPSDPEDTPEEPSSDTAPTIIAGIISKNHFAESLRTLQGTFPSQTDDTWAQITSAVQSTMSDEQPLRLSSILILFPQSMDPDLPICFAQKLAKSINEAFHVQNHQNKASSQFKQIDAHYFARSSSLTSVHNDLRSYLLRDGGKAVIIQNLDQIQNEDHLMVLHAFCDNSDSMAYDTRANFIATLSVPESILNGSAKPAPDWAHRNGGKISKIVLDSVWKRVTSDDKRGAVISRVAGNVILLNEGDGCR